MPHVRATLRLDRIEDSDDGSLHVHANSEARFDRVLRTIRQLDPSITVVDESRLPAHDSDEAAWLTAEDAEAAAILDPANPAIGATLEEIVREYEQQWLDEPIPALAGQTPRQAAEDPTRRDDLIRLLDSFPASHGPATMSPDRLRVALGLNT